MNPKDLLERIASANPERLEAYHRMFDRILLYTIASQLIPDEAINKLIGNADKIIKQTIDKDASIRTTYLQTTKQGRKDRIEGAFDGEDVRLEFIKTWEIVKDIVKGNLKSPRNNENNESPNDSD